MISGFRREVQEISAFMGYYAAHSGNSLPTFRDNVSVPYSRINRPKKEEDKNVFPCQMEGTQCTHLSCTQSCTDSLVSPCKNICLWLRQHTFRLSLFPLFISIILKLPRRKSNKNKSLRCRTSHCRRPQSNKEMVEWVVS